MSFEHTTLNTHITQPDPKGQRIDERAHDAVHTFAALHTPEHDGAEYRILLPRSAREQPAPCRMENAGRADAERPGTFAQTSGKHRVEGALRFHDPGATVDVDESERRRGFHHFLQHLVEERLVLAASTRVFELCDKASERQR